MTELADSMQNLLTGRSTCMGILGPKLGECLIWFWDRFKVKAFKPFLCRNWDYHWGLEVRSQGGAEIEILFFSFWKQIGRICPGRLGSILAQMTKDVPQLQRWRGPLHYKECFRVGLEGIGVQGLQWKDGPTLRGLCLGGTNGPFLQGGGNSHSSSRLRLFFEGVEVLFVP